MGTKIIENIDEETWNKFAGYCKMQSSTIGDQLNNVIKDFLDKNIKIKEVN